jgi:hypothetical protein
MYSSAECRERAEQKLAQADRDPRHRRRLIEAAQAWLLLASRTRRLEASVRIPSKRSGAKVASNGIKTFGQTPSCDRPPGCSSSVEQGARGGNRMTTWCALCWAKDGERVPADKSWERDADLCMVRVLVQTPIRPHNRGATTASSGVVKSL